jgi:ribonuclease J
LPSLINTPNKILITSIGNVDKISGFTAPSHTISHDIENIIADAKGKIIFATTDSDFYKMFFIMKMVAQKGRPIYFYDKLAEQQMKTMFANKYFSFKAPFKFLKSEELATATNALIIVTAQISNLYPLLTDIINGDDNLIKIEKTDSFVVGSPTINGYEKYHAELFDDANEADIENIVDLGKKVSQIKAGNEDHKFLITTVKPNYIIPVGGLYMDFVNYKNVASLSTNRESVIFADNGQKIRFDNGNLQRSSKEDFIHLEPQFIGSHGVADSGASSMFEREQMKNNGALVVSLMIGKQTKTISKYNFDQVGIVNMDDATIAATNEINKEIVEDLNKLLAASPTGENIDLKEFKNIIKKISQKKYEKKFDKKPLVLSTIIFSKGN